MDPTKSEPDRGMTLKPQHVRVAFWIGLSVQSSCLILQWTLFREDPTARDLLGLGLVGGALVVICSIFVFLRIAPNERL